ncbi:MAG TPA: PDZ domain-containing protein, partial [Microbacterium sp.]|nr:PDZ domain-containing protein [Microbacterium sp.]
GLKRGDIVTEFNGVPIASANDLTAQVRAAAAGSTAKVVYVRSGKTYTTEATLGALKL